MKFIVTTFLITSINSQWYFATQPTSLYCLDKNNTLIQTISNTHETIFQNTKDIQSTLKCTNDNFSFENLNKPSLLNGCSNNVIDPKTKSVIINTCNGSKVCNKSKDYVKKDDTKSWKSQTDFESQCTTNGNFITQ